MQLGAPPPSRSRANWSAASGGSAARSLTLCSRRIFCAARSSCQKPSRAAAAIATSTPSASSPSEGRKVTARRPGTQRDKLAA